MSKAKHSVAWRVGHLAPGHTKWQLVPVTRTRHSVFQVTLQDDDDNDGGGGGGGGGGSGGGGGRWKVGLCEFCLVYLKVPYR